MKKIKVISILGTRPEIIKMSQLLVKFDCAFKHRIIHTDQHYDDNMSKVFFKELGLRNADYYLDVGSGSHAYQTAAMLVRIEKILLDERPDMVVVQGDTNTTMAGALVVAKLNMLLVHIEAGCRSFNKAMPEELNRILTDHCSDILFAPDDCARENLLREGCHDDNIYMLGSTAHEACLRNIGLAVDSKILKNLNLIKRGYLVVTLHRAENLGDIHQFREIILTLNYLAESIPIVFPLHPRTKKLMKNVDLELCHAMKVIEPVGYLDFLKLLEGSKFVLTDSGGIQEECAVLGRVCMIMRNETEWIDYIKLGRNKLVGSSREKIISSVEEVLNNHDLLIEMENKKVVIYEDVSDKIVSVLLGE